MLLGLAGCAALSALGAAAQDKFPSKPLRIIVPFAAGGGNDAVARQVGEALSSILGQPVIVENRPGAGGNIGTDYVAKSPPDGYTMLHGSNGLVVNPYLYKKLPFDAQKDLAPIGLLATSPLLILANPKAPVSSLADLVQQLKDRKTKLSYASPGAGTPHHFAMELLSSHTHSDLVHIPYKGASPALTDVVGGQVPLLVSTPQSVADFVATGRLRILATMDPARLPEYPDVPAVAEAVPGFSVAIWHALFVPANTPQPVVDVLSAALAKALADPQLQKRLSTVGFTAKSGTGAEVKARMASELASWKSVAEKAKIVPE